MRIGSKSESVRSRKCRRCGKHKAESRYTGYKCRACYEYKRLNGVERPANLWSDNALCNNCQEKPIHAKGECNACYKYRITHGESRPSYLWATECINCSAPLVKRNKNRGRCPACHKYFERHNVERPQYRWTRYCDCGAVATLLDVSLVFVIDGQEHSELYDLCESCNALLISE